MKKRLIDELRSRSFEKRIRADTKLIDTESRTIPFVIVSKDNAGERFDWWEGKTYIEELDVNGADLSQLRTFFKDHRPSVDTAIGRVDNVRLDAGEIKCDVVFGSDDDSLKVFQKYVDGILSDVSIGYTIQEIVETEKKGEPSHVLVTRFTPVELSAVWRGFDQGAKVGREAEVQRESDSQKIELDSIKRKINLMEKEIV